MVDQTHPEALPDPSFIHLNDEVSMDQSEWRDGALHTRVLDKEVNVRAYRLSWQNVTRSIADGIRMHYEHFAAGGTRERQFPLRLPGGGDPLPAMWRGVPSFLATSNGFFNVEGVVDFLTATDLNLDDAQPPKIVDQDSDLIVTQVGGLTIVIQKNATTHLVYP